MKPILDFFSSVKLTLALLLGLSAVAVFGTIWPVEQGTILRFELYFQSLWFRLLLGLLALNLSACTWKTFVGVLGEKKRLLGQLKNADPAMQKTGHDLACQDIDELSSRLQEQGYSVTLTGDRLLARRGVIGRWALPALHLSILVIMVGALAAQLGFVGTRSVLLFALIILSLNIIRLICVLPPTTRKPENSCRSSRPVKGKGWTSLPV
jgi:cytochrome c biogenesis protein